MSSVAVIGLGNIGTVFGVHLAVAARHHVFGCVRRAPGELGVVTPTGELRAAIPCITDPAQASPVDWVLLCTKALDIAAIEPWFARLCCAGTRVAIVQNGVDQEARIAPILGPARAVPTVVYANSKRIGENRVRHLTPGRDLAVANNEDGRALAQLFEGSAVRVTLEDDLTTVSWHKFLLNIIANPLTAITGRGLGVFRQPDMEALAIQMMREAADVGRAVGAHLEPDEPEKLLQWMSNYPADTGTSMLEDRQAGRPLEHEALTGVLVRLGREHGIPTPMNAAILALLRGLSLC